MTKIKLEIDLEPYEGEGVIDPEMCACKVHPDVVTVLTGGDFNPLVMEYMDQFMEADAKARYNAEVASMTAFLTAFAAQCWITTGRMEFPEEMRIEIVSETMQGIFHAALTGGVPKSAVDEQMQRNMLMATQVGGVQ